jgi:hypothetical protein
MSGVEKPPDGSTTDNLTVGPVLKADTYEVPSMMLSRKHWDRLKDQINECKIGWTDLWLGGAFAFFGVAVSTLVVRQTLPGPSASTVSASRLSSEVRAVLLVIVIASAVLFVASLAAWLNMRVEHNADLASVVRNMESHEPE